MTVCIRCHRPLQRPTETGMGPVCAAKASKPIPQHERDLFGYDIDAAVSAALERLRLHIARLAAEAHIANRRAAVKARRRMGVWR